jgi:hypothetical protein
MESSSGESNVQEVVTRKSANHGRYDGIIFWGEQCSRSDHTEDQSQEAPTTVDMMESSSGESNVQEVITRKINLAIYVYLR